MTRVHENHARLLFGFTGYSPCVASHSLSTLLMRVCQPFPPALKYSITSASSLIVVDCFGLAETGRPLRTSFSPSYRSAARKSASVHSGASSSSAKVKVLAEFFNFPFICFPHRNNPSMRRGIPVWAVRPDNKDKPPMQKSCSDVASLAIGFPVIRQCVMQTCKNVFRVGKIQSPCCQGNLPFLLVIFQLHTFPRYRTFIIVVTINTFSIGKRLCPALTPPLQRLPCIVSLSRHTPPRSGLAPRLSSPSALAHCSAVFMPVSYGSVRGRTARFAASW